MSKQCSYCKMELCQQALTSLQLDIEHYQLSAQVAEKWALCRECCDKSAAIAQAVNAIPIES